MTPDPRTPQGRAELRKLCEKATEGPWEWQTARTIRHLVAPASSRGGLLVSAPAKTHKAVHGGNEEDEANLALLAASRLALPAALDRIEELEGKLPKTGDGQPVLFRTNYWLSVPADGGAWSTVGCGVLAFQTPIEPDEAMYVRVRDMNGEEHEVQCTLLYSTEQAALAAME